MKKRRNKTYKQRPAVVPMIVKADLTMRPIEEIIEHIEVHGTLPVDDRGEPVYTTQHGDTLPLWEVIDGMVTTFEMWCTRHNKQLPLSPLRMFVGALHYSMPITTLNLEAIKQCLPRLREAARHMDREDMHDLVVQTQIKAEIEAKEAK